MTSKPPFKLFIYSKSNLAKVLSNKLTSIDEVKLKFQYEYFLEYLGDGTDSLNAKTIIAENKYVSKSYLYDYSNYYSTCFYPYDRFCKRIHFFSEKISKKQFNLMLHSDNDEFEKKWQSYLGFIVVKPLPGGKIGDTLLNTYKQTEANKRIYSSTRDYTVNLFGKELKIKTLAFQEQDTIVSACATTALWSAFNMVSDKFQTTLPSPIEITKSAQSSYFEFGRILPAKGGLDHRQICNAIENIGLVTELRNSSQLHQQADDLIKDFLKAFIYSYLKMGLPVLLGIKVEGKGEHLITIVGFKEYSPDFENSEKISLSAQRIKRFYAHDDQCGPFSRIEFKENKKIQTAWWKKEENEFGKTIVLKDENGKPLHLDAVVTSVFIPVSPKIRITFEDIFPIVSRIDLLLFGVFDLQRELVWDIYLQLSNDYKKNIKNDKRYNLRLKSKLLTKSLPKYIWVARGEIFNNIGIEMIFDATSISTAKHLCVSINIVDVGFYSFWKRNFQIPEFIDRLKSAFKLKKINSEYLNLIDEELELI